MEPLSWNIYRYRLPFTRPMRMLGRNLTFREGLVLQILDTQQKCGEGEIAPLEGVHQENLEDAERTLLSILEGKEVVSPEFPSIRFGLEMAWNVYLAKIHHQKLIPKNLSALPVNALMTSDVENIDEFAQHQRKSGFKAVKMKVGVKPIEEEINRVLTLKKHLGHHISLRLDANRAWTLEEALKFASAIEHAKVEYCEEPLKNPEQLASFSEKSELPLALDETVYETGNPDSLPTTNIKALVLKPSRLGGWKSCQKWVDWALQKKLHVTFSSCLESGMGLNWIACMNASMVPAPTPAGLDTFQNIKANLIDPPFQLTKGHYSISQDWPRFLCLNAEKIASGRLDTHFLKDFQINPDIGYSS